MITVKPIEDNIRKEQLLSQYHCSAADSTILVMKDGVCELGYAAIDLIQGKLLIRNIFLTNGSAQELNAENKIYIDFLRSAAASYGANHGAYQMENCGGTAFIFVSKGLFWSMEYVPFQSAKLYKFAIRIIPKRKTERSFFLVFSCLFRFV